MNPVEGATAVTAQDADQPQVGRRRSSPQASVDQAWRDHFERGLDLVREQQFAAALSQLSQAIVNAPDDEIAQCYATRGYAQLCLGQFDAALNDCTQAIAHDPTDGESFAWRGSAHAGKRLWRAAIDDYAMAVQLAPDAAEEYASIARAHAERAVAELTEQQRHGPASAQLFQDRGVAYATLEDHEHALRDFTQALKLDSRDQVSHLKRAECHAALGQFEKVIGDCRSAMALGARSPEVYFLCGQAQRYAGHAEQALVDLTKAIELDPQHAAACYERGRIYQTLGKVREALADFTQALQLVPNMAAYCFARAEIHAALDEHAAAVDDYSQALVLLPDDVPTLMARAQALLRSGRHDEALADFDAVLAIDAASAEAFQGRGLVMRGRGALDLAVVEFSKAIRLNNRYAEAFSSRGDAFLEQQQFDQAIADFTKAIELEKAPPALAALHYRRGLALLDAGRADRAAADFDRSLELEPQQADALAWRGSARGHLRQWRGAVDDLRQALALQPAAGELYGQLSEACTTAALEDLNARLKAKPSDAVLLLDRASVLDFAGEAQAALEDYRASIKQDANQLDAYVRRASLLARNHKYEHAVHDYTRALKLNDRCAAAWHGRGLALKRLHRWPEALADLNRALPLEESAALRFDRAEVLAQLGKQREALVEYGRALAMDPRHARAWFGRGQVYAALQKWDEAIADYTQSLEIAPAQPLALFHRGEACVLTKRFKRALADFEAAMAADPAFVLPYCSRGLTLARIGAQDQAIIELTKAAARIKYDVAFAAAIAARGRVYYSMGRFQRAAADYTFVLQLKPPGQNYAQIHYGRGLAILQLGDFAAAEKCFAKAVEANPALKPAQTALAWVRSDRSGERPAELRTPETKSAWPKPPVISAAVAVDTARSAEWQVDPLWDQWLVRTPEGREFGPCTKLDLDRWCAAGRLHPAYWLLRLDWEDWQPAGDIYFELTFETHRSNNRPIPVTVVTQPIYEDHEPVEEETAASDKDGNADAGEAFPGIKF